MEFDDLLATCAPERRRRNPKKAMIQSDAWFAKMVGKTIGRAAADGANWNPTMPSSSIRSRAKSREQRYHYQL